MEVWLVGVSDCESNEIKGLYSTKKLAEKRLFEIRDELVASWKEQIRGGIGDYVSNKKSWRSLTKKLYLPMIKALSSNDYKSWNNHPHDRPYIQKYTVWER